MKPLIALTNNGIWLDIYPQSRTKEQANNILCDDYCIKRLKEAIPEIILFKDRYDETIEDYLKSRYDAHLIYESIFTKLVLSLINKDTPTHDDKDILRRSFELIEELVESRDFYTKNIAEIGFLEPLLAYIEPTNKIKVYALPKSLESAKEIGYSAYGFDSITWKKRKFDEIDINTKTRRSKRKKSLVEKR